MNKVILIGNLTRDPDYGETQSGISFCNFSIAVNRPYSDSNGERQTDFFNIKTWRGQADNCAKYLRKGSKVGVVGSLQTRTYEDNDGNKRNSDTEYVTHYANYPTDILKFSRDRNAVHPTQKPVALLEYLIKTYTKEGEVVMDNCMGSGSTGISCKNTGRQFIGIEADDYYFQTAKDQIKKGYSV